MALHKLLKVLDMSCQWGLMLDLLKHFAVVGYNDAVSPAVSAEFMTGRSTSMNQLHNAQSFLPNSSL